MSITYADIRKFIFHMKDNENKKASTVFSLNTHSDMYGIPKKYQK